MKGQISKPPLLNKPVTGWCEWVDVPTVSPLPILAKMDTGARTSSLHALDVHLVTLEEGVFVQFKVHPKQRSRLPELICQAPLLEQRIFKDSGGHREKRYVVSVGLHMGGKSWPIELSLTNRSTMGFRLLLGRTALRGWLVAPGKSHILTRKHLD
ncbi:MAG: ATP-dependent zinc protease [Magnetococcales bacterium]|nr:ATP-dependent zinc protease [Magnetococcales bacterium]NGZ27392.1 ATP-dependent zinc protease [Magnetococcales bacterium]